MAAGERAGMERAEAPPSHAAEQLDSAGPNVNAADDVTASLAQDAGSSSLLDGVEAPL